jgi:dGTPase
MRNRLTHTIEVAHISQTIARKLRLNYSLVEAIAYGHDIGHTPFGHVGERTLNLFMNCCGDYKGFNQIDSEFRGFKHNFQGIRVVSFLENISNSYPGLDLTDLTLWGILYHTSTDAKPCGFKSPSDRCNLHFKNDFCINIPSQLNYNFYNKYSVQFKPNTSWSVEGLVVRMADEIAQRHHDLEDGLFAGIIDRDEIIENILSNFRDILPTTDLRALSDISKELDLTIFINQVSRFLINFFVNRLVHLTRNNLECLAKDYSIKSIHDFSKAKEDICCSKEIHEIVAYDSVLSLKEQKFQSFLKSRILNSHLAQSMDGKADYILRNLIKAYISNPQQLPDNTIIRFFKRYIPKYEQNDLKVLNSKASIGLLRDRLRKEHDENRDKRYRGILIRSICDYIGGMTDAYALMQYNKLYGTGNVFRNNPS